jgi:hypothetical protein
LKAKKNFDRTLSGESFTIEEEYGDTALERRCYKNSYNPIIDENGDIIGLTLFLTDIIDQKKTENERDRLIDELQEALSRVKMLSGLVPICSKCKKIHDDSGYRSNVEARNSEHTDASFTHGICPNCQVEMYGSEEWYHEFKQKKKTLGPFQIQPN